MVKTYGLTHLALSVRDAKKSLRFYQQIFGAKVTYQAEGWIEIQTPGAKDFITLEQKSSGSSKFGKTGGIAHFGFRLTNPKDIDKAIRAIKLAGGKILKTGEFSPGHPYVFFQDSDGYEIEIWYE